MTIVPIRGVGATGAVPDLYPYDSPITGWTNVKNVRFQPEGVIRSPVFKEFNVKPTMASDPVFIFDDSHYESARSLAFVRRDGSISRLTEGAYSDATPTTGAWTQTGKQLTSTKLGGLIYVNNADHTPLLRGALDAKFRQIGGGWGATDSCVSLRSYRDFLVALNVSKGGVRYPNMVKWSDAAQVGVEPSWDTTSESTLGGENVLNNASGYLVDGAELRGSFYLYGTKEVFRMDYVGGPFIFSFERVFSDLGVMAPNCVVEVDAKHFVFAQDGIVVTDGITKQSLVHSRVKNRIFQYIDFLRKEECHVIHDSVRQEVMFCYPSTHPSTARPVGGPRTGCNEAAVYNYKNDTWSFIDLPGVASGCEIFPPSGSEDMPDSTWETALTWAESTYSWNASAGYTPPILILTVTQGDDADAGLYFYDEFNGRLDNTAAPSLIYAAFAEAMFKDFDDFGLSLSDSKRLNAVFPQIETDDPETTVAILASSAMTNIANVQWTRPQLFNPYTDVKSNFRVQGRYISLRFEIEAGKFARIGGYDLEIYKIAGR